MAKPERKDNYKNYPEIPTNEKISAEDYNNLVNNLDILQNRENLLETNLKFIEDELFKIMKVYNYYILYYKYYTNDRIDIRYNKLFDKENKKELEEKDCYEVKKCILTFDKEIFKYVFCLIGWNPNGNAYIKFIVITISGNNIKWEEKIPNEFNNIEGTHPTDGFHLDFCYFENDNFLIFGRFQGKDWIYNWNKNAFSLNSPYSTKPLESNDEKNIDNCIGLTHYDFDNNKFYYYTIYENSIYKISCKKGNLPNNFYPDRWESEKIYSGSNIKNFVIGLDEKLKFVDDDGWKTMDNIKLDLDTDMTPFLIFYSTASLYQTIPKEMIIDTSIEEVFKNWLTTAAGLYDLGYDQFKDVADMNNNTGKFKENLDKIMSAPNGTMDLFKIVNKKTNICFVVFTRKEGGNSYLSFIVGDNGTGKIFYEKSSFVNFGYYNDWMRHITSINKLFEVFDDFYGHKETENDGVWLKFFIDGFIGFDVDK